MSVLEAERLERHVEHRVRLRRRGRGVVLLAAACHLEKNPGGFGP